MLFRFSLFAAICLSNAAFSLTIEHRTEDLRPILPLTLDLKMTGLIEDGDAFRLAAILASYEASDFREINITLDSPGGSLVEGLAIARLLTGRTEIVTSQVGTEEHPNAECASACVLIYVAADLRYLVGNGRIGVHQFYAGSGEISGDVAIDIAQRLSSEIIALLRDQGVALAFFERMSATSRGIDWVPRERLEYWRVVTGSVFDERMEYKNIEGRVALHMTHESLFGTNQMTLFCDSGMYAYAVLEEPELAQIGVAALVLDGQVFRMNEFEILNRNDGRTRFAFQIPHQLMRVMSDAGTIGARIVTPGGDLFWGFEQTIRDERVAEMVDGCLSLAGVDAVNMMTEYPSTDFLGADLTQNGIRDVSFRECQQICIDADACQAVSYVRSSRWCWPKSDARNPSYSPNVDSARKP
jgi:ATP-dependent protease ClpP protease subunit